MLSFAYQNAPVLPRFEGAEPFEEDRWRPPGCARSGVDFFGHHAGPSTERVPQPSSLLRGTAGVAEGNRGLPEWPNRPVYQGKQQESRRVTEAFPSGPTVQSTKGNSRSRGG